MIDWLKNLVPYKTLDQDWLLVQRALITWPAIGTCLRRRNKKPETRERTGDGPGRHEKDAGRRVCVCVSGVCVVCV